MFERIITLSKDIETSIFLFGARQTGKSTFLRTRFRDAVYIDLLNSELAMRYKSQPSILYEQLKRVDSSKIVIIDEIAEVPELLNEVHRVMSECDIRFILCGSSARKLKRKGYNTLGGRATPYYFMPLVSREIPNFDIDKAVNDGMLPRHYLSKNSLPLLAAYVDVYLKEEIRSEAIVRNLSTFQRFLEVAAMTDGEMVNYNNIAADCCVSATTVKSYFNILEDTLIGFMLPAFVRHTKRREVQAPRFYYFDVGITNHLLGRRQLKRGDTDYGHAFEHFMIQEIRAYLSYYRYGVRLSYWRTYTGIEVDAVVGNGEVAIEIKSVDEVKSQHLKGLRFFGEEMPDSRLIIVSFDRLSRDINGVEALYYIDFLDDMWNGKLF